MNNNYIDETALFNEIRSKKKPLNEANVNRLIKWLTTTDCGFITAFCTKLTNIKNKNKTYFGSNKEWEEEHIFTHEENRQKIKIWLLR